MYERLKRLYEEGRLDKSGIQNAVAKGLITQEEADEITAPRSGEDTIGDAG